MAGLCNRLTNAGVIPSMRKAFLIALLFVAWHVGADDGWQPFIVESFDGRKIEAKLAVVPVRENRQVPNSRLIRVAVVRLRGSDTPATAPPIVFLTGGPGIPATVLARVPVYFDLFERLREVGDVLLVDQRGTGMSLPNLICPAMQIRNDFASSDQTMRDALRMRVATCANYWRSVGVDLNGYNTREIAEDINAVRRHVGVPSMKLLAFSYGSEVGFEILRRWPKTVDRVVFASTRAPDTLLKSPAAWDSHLASIGVLAGIPLPALVQETLARLDRSPISVKVGIEEFQVGGIGLLSILRSDLTDGRALPNVPILVESARGNDVGVLGVRLHKLRQSLGTSFNLMPLAVDCSSGWSQKRMSQVQSEADAAIMRNVNLQWSPEICAEITPVGTPPPVGTIKVQALFITGTLDANAPIAQTERIRRHFRISKHVIVENGAHETLPALAVQDLVAQFLKGVNVSAQTIVVPSPLRAKNRPAG